MAHREVPPAARELPSAHDVDSEVAGAIALLFSPDGTARAVSKIPALPLLPDSDNHSRGYDTGVDQAQLLRALRHVAVFRETCGLEPDPTLPSPNIDGLPEDERKLYSAHFAGTVCPDGSRGCLWWDFHVSGGKLRNVYGTFKPFMDALIRLDRDHPSILKCLKLHSAFETEDGLVDALGVLASIGDTFSVDELVLSRNPVGERAGMAVAAYLATNPCVSKLSLLYTKGLADRGKVLSALAAVLSDGRNTKLRELDLRQCGSSSYGASCCVRGVAMVDFMRAIVSSASGLEWVGGLTGEDIVPTRASFYDVLDRDYEPVRHYGLGGGPNCGVGPQMPSNFISMRPGGPSRGFSSGLGCPSISSPFSTNQMSGSCSKAPTSAAVLGAPSSAEENACYWQLLIGALRRNRLTVIRSPGHPRLWGMLLAAAIRDCTNLRVVDFSNAKMNQAYVVAIATALLAGTCVVEELDLSNNHVRKPGAEALAAVLAQPSCTIKRLLLKEASLGEFSNVPEDGILFFAKAFESNTQCEVIDFRENPNSHSASIVKVLEAASANPNARLISLGGKYDSFWDKKYEVALNAIRERVFADTPNVKPSTHQ